MCSVGTILVALFTTMSASMRNVVGPRLREARYKAGQKVTQEQLAARLQTLGLSLDRTAISKIEVGRRPVTDIEIVAICKALSVDIITLFPDP